jgi:predicted MFS family arabinose efflux permease
MAMPFYVVYARQELGAAPEAIGWFILFQALGGVLANLLWARLVDRFGSRWMLAVCATLSALTPLLAVELGFLGWVGMLPVIFLGGATTNGRSVGFSSALLEIAPAGERPTYSALDAVLILPVAVLPLVAGVFLQHWSYRALFLLTVGFVSLGAVLTRQLPPRARQKLEQQ